MSLPAIFPYPSWYLDAVCGEGNWRVVEARDGNGQLTGVLPYYTRRKWGLKLITPPPLAPRLGPHLFPPGTDLKLASLHDFHWRTLTVLAEQLPEMAYARIQWPYDLQYGLPWQQLGWRQEVRYSYCLDLSLGTEELWNNLQARVRTTIRKAEKSVQITASNDWGELYQLTQGVFQHRGIREQIDEALIHRLGQAASEHQCGQMWLAQDERQQVCGGLFLLWDRDTAYNLLLATNAVGRSSGTASLLLWHAITAAKAKGLTTFDFEGSHLEGVEPFFRSFGGEAKSYYQFTKMKWWLRPFRP